MYPLQPNTRAERVLAFSEAQVIGQAVVFIDTGIRVVARRRGDRRWSDRRRATADDNGARTTTLKKYQILRDCRSVVAYGRTHPKVAELTTVGEKTRVSVKPNVWLRITLNIV